jgi:Ca-activated chloride channel family protein
MGYAVGGAKGIESFRENIENGYLPLSTDITYEGMFYEYTFDTGKSQPCNELFCPSYVGMASTDPLSANVEQYLSVGLNSGIAADTFKRKKLNLVVVLDISGSMGSPFDAYYYDDPNATGSSKSKMTLANEALVAMLDHLGAGDRFGMVLFESEAHLGKPLSDVATTDMAAIKKHILDITETGGTNMEAGYAKGTTLFSGAIGSDPEQFENRIVFLTDAMPNLGDTSEGSLLGMVEKNAQQKIHTTFIGIGVDFNTALIEAITKVRGANYYSVHSEKAFKERMDEEFEFMVTPLVFDLELAFNSSSFAIDKVYGSPEADQATGVLMYVNTLFPSKVEDGETKGGVILLGLNQTGTSSAMQLTTSYKDRTEQPFSTQASFTYDAPVDVAPNTGIRKAILLTRYVRLMKEWIEAERSTLQSTNPSDWERESVPLVVSPQYKQAMQVLVAHMQAEMPAIGDPDLQQEIDLLNKLISWQAP